MNNQDLSQSKVVDCKLFNINGVAPLYGKQYEAVQTRFRGYDIEIQKLTSYLDSLSHPYERLSVNEDVTEIRMMGENLTPELIEMFPALKATGLRENFMLQQVEVWLSDTGFKVLTKCEDADCFDSAAEGGNGRWSWENDMMDGADCSFIHMQTGERVNVNYYYPYGKLWNDDNYLLEKEGQFYSTKNDTLDFIIKENTIIEYKGLGGRVVIPDGVTSIDWNVFRDNMTIKELSFPSSIRHIGFFENCAGIERIVFADGLEDIGAWTFQNCSSLKEVIFPGTLKSVGNSCFRGCTSLERIDFPETIEIIREWAFRGCSNLSTINLPKSLRIIERAAFEGCEKIDFSNLCIPANLVSVGADNFNQMKNTPPVVYNADHSSLLYYSSKNKDTDFIIPETVRSIGAEAFFGCNNLRSVTIPLALEHIGEGAFESCCNLQKINIPANVNRIEKRTFFYCHSLNDISLPENISYIGDRAFMYTGLQKITIPPGVTEIKESTFSYCKRLSEIVLFDGVAKIGSWAFAGCSELRAINIPPSVKTIEERAFADCEKLERLLLEAGLESIGKEAFKGCKNLKKVELHDGVKTISEGAFADCLYLDEINLPDGLRDVGKKALSNTAITQIIIPGSMKEVSVGLMLKCRKLKKVLISETTEKIGGKAFAECQQLEEVHIAGNLKKKYGAKVFYKSPQVIVFGIPGSNTEELAKENNIRFKSLVESYESDNTCEK